MKGVFAKLVFLLGLLPLASPAVPLKEAFAADFLMGTALGSRDEDDHIYPLRKDIRELEVLVREFNRVTPENVMKSRYLQPREGFFHFEQADECMAFGGFGMEPVAAVSPGLRFDDLGDMGISSRAALKYVMCKCV